MPARHFEDSLVDEGVKQRGKIKDQYGRNQAADKAEVLATDWSCTKE